MSETTINNRQFNYRVFEKVCYGLRIICFRWTAVRWTLFLYSVAILIGLIIFLLKPQPASNECHHLSNVANSLSEILRLYVGTKRSRSCIYLLSKHSFNLCISNLTYFIFLLTSRLLFPTKLLLALLYNKPYIHTFCCKPQFSK